MCVCVCLCVCVCVRARVYVCEYIVFVCACVCVCVCVRVWVFGLCVWVCVRVCRGYETYLSMKSCEESASHAFTYTRLALYTLSFKLGTRTNRWNVGR
jgi:EamA domain-containing membrane protein RarD